MNQTRHLCARRAGFFCHDATKTRALLRGLLSTCPMPILLNMAFIRPASTSSTIFFLFSQFSPHSVANYADHTIKWSKIYSCIHFVASRELRTFKRSLQFAPPWIGFLVKFLVGWPPDSMYV
jgi:hypothetical protein